MALRAAKFVSDLRKFGVIGIDSSALIYHLDGTRPYADLTEEAFAAVAGGSPRAVISTVSVTEVLVKPYADGQLERVEGFDQFVRSLPNAACVAPDYDTAREAARLRARYGLRTPDALLIATTRRHGAEAFLTNDDGLRKLRGEGLTMIVLDDYV